MKQRALKNWISKENFLFLLPLFFVLHGYVENFHSVPEINAGILLLKYLLGTAVITGIFYLIYKDKRKAALFTLLFLCINFFFGAIHDLIKKIIPGFFLAKYSFILPLVFLLLILGFILIKRARRAYNRQVRFINILLAVLILFDIITLAYKIFNTKSDKALISSYQFERCDSCAKPDIYLVIADEYAGLQALKDNFAFDNTLFLNELRKRGFSINEGTISNYNFTPYSVASTLNMDYLPPVDSIINKKSLTQAYNIINNNAVVHFLKNQGYEFRNFSIFTVDDQAAQTEQGSLVTKEGLINNQTLISRINKDLGYHLVTTWKITPVIRKVTYTDFRNNELLIKKLKQEVTAISTKPRFVYTHLMMPHYPYYQDKNGNFNPLDSIVEGMQGKMNKYIDYLQYSNRFFLSLLNYIEKNKKKESIIIFMSDHGYREYPVVVPRQYQFMNLQAISLPAKRDSSFYQGRSNVNLFRTLFNNQFGQRLPILKDSTIFLKEY